METINFNEYKDAFPDMEPTEEEMAIMADWYAALDDMAGGIHW